jgi:dTDP-4-dehydrorhamnose reductase
LRVLVAGAGGLVGRAVNEHCRRLGDEVFSYDRNSLDITDASVVVQTLEHKQPEAVINCAAWTDVDGCELDPSRAQAVNAEGPENLARASRKVGAAFVTISTDYVFDGLKDGYYTQRDDPNPQSVYGGSKLEGERRAQRVYARTVVVRTGFIFGPGGKNFLSTIVERAQSGERLMAIKDAIGTPTYSRHLAARLRDLAELDLPAVFHVVNSGDGATYEGFARVALQITRLEAASIEIVTMESLNRPAPRPRNSRLRCLISGAVGLPPLPFWQDAVKDFVSPVSNAEVVA